ncbi:hypothetical protein BDW68DRAFT_156885 [Aspergillus falconensis]
MQLGLVELAMCKRPGLPDINTHERSTPSLPISLSTCSSRCIATWSSSATRQDWLSRYGFHRIGRQGRIPCFRQGPQCTRPANSSQQSMRNGESKGVAGKAVQGRWSSMVRQPQTGGNPIILMDLRRMSGSRTVRGREKSLEASRGSASKVATCDGSDTLHALDWRERCGPP